MTTTKGVAAQIAAGRGGGRSSKLGLLAALAVIIGYFMPWVPAEGMAHKALGVQRGKISAKSSPGAQREELGKRLSDGEALSGADWSAVLDSMADEAKLDERQARRVAIVSVGVKWLPWIAGSLALLMLLLSLPALKVQQAGLVPLAVVLRLVQSRFFSGFTLHIVMLLGLVVFVITQTLWLGSKMTDEDGGRTGHGIFLMMAGSGVSFLSALVGFGPGRVRALVTTLVLFVLLAVVALFFANP